MRKREIDFLRGIAIIFVLFRHEYLLLSLKNMGWIGVDLFFVLSGFLISQLIFKEYNKTGDFLLKRFLIRRAFRIYPLFFLSLPFYFFINKNVSINGVISDLTFTSNYFYGWGYLFGASWSLAVEEHFYIFFPLTFWLLNKFISLKKVFNLKKVIFLFITFFILVLCIRVCRISNFPELIITNQLDVFRSITMSHLRIDSLVFGVFISFLYSFNNVKFGKLVMKYQFFLFILFLIGICWTPFVDVLRSKFALTFGFSILYVSFGLLLSIFLYNNKINYFLDKIFTKTIVDLISKIGFSSYSIYIIHIFINYIVPHIVSYLGLPENYVLMFFYTSTTSIVLGWLITLYFERKVMEIRNKIAP